MVLFDFEIRQILRSSELVSSTVQSDLQTQRAQTICRNLKCLLTQLLLEVLCICLQRGQMRAAAEGDALRRASSEKLNVDYTRVFGGEWLSAGGLELEQKLVECMHAVLVEEPLVIE